MNSKSKMPNVPASPLRFYDEFLGNNDELNARPSAEEMESQHRERTSLCPSLRDLAMLELTEEQQGHTKFCNYCKKMLRVARERLPEK